MKTVCFFGLLTFRFCSTLGIAPFAAAPDTVVSVENITDQRRVQQKLPLHFIHFYQQVRFHNFHIKSPSLQPADVSEEEVRVVGGLGTGHERAGDLSAGDIGRTISGLRSRRSRGE